MTIAELRAVRKALDALPRRWNGEVRVEVADTELERLLRALATALGDRSEPAQGGRWTAER